MQLPGLGSAFEVRDGLGSVLGGLEGSYECSKQVFFLCLGSLFAHECNCQVGLGAVLSDVAEHTPDPGQCLATSVLPVLQMCKGCQHLQTT